MAISDKTTETRRADITLSLFGEPVTVSVDIPTGTTTARRMLPIFREACRVVVDATVKKVEQYGRTVSCSAGCGACCRQLVPISMTEARMIAELVHSLPEERRNVLLERFGNAVKTIADSGLKNRLTSAVTVPEDEYRSMALEYFRLGIPCPFLENESCSIHPDRPLVCREYLVVSPPENCARQNDKPIEAIRMPGQASEALASLTAIENEPARVPLPLAIEWAEANPADDPVIPSEELARAFFSRMIGG